MVTALICTHYDTALLAGATYEQANCYNKAERFGTKAKLFHTQYLMRISTNLLNWFFINGPDIKTPKCSIGYAGSWVMPRRQPCLRPIFIALGLYTRRFYRNTLNKF
jgi:hypothetical protein